MKSDEAETRKLILSCGEELEVTPARLRMFRAGIGWSLKRLATECAAVMAGYYGEHSRWFDWKTLKHFEDGHGDLGPRNEGVLKEVMARHCFVAVERGVAGVVLKREELARD
jgi:hypothetical protein